MTVMDGGRMLLNGQGHNHDSSGLNSYPTKAELCGRVLHNIGNTTIKNWSKVTQTKFKISSSTGVCIHRLSILLIMMFVFGVSSTSLLHADNDKQRNHLPRLTTHELKLNNNDSTDQELEESFHILFSSTPVDYGHGKESSYLYPFKSTDQETEQSSNILSFSTPVDHGYGKESSYSYLPVPAHAEPEEFSNIHSSSTPVDHGREGRIFFFFEKDVHLYLF